MTVNYAVRPTCPSCIVLACFSLHHPTHSNVSGVSSWASFDADVSKLVRVTDHTSVNICPLFVTQVFSVMVSVFRVSVGCFETFSFDIAPLKILITCLSSKQLACVDIYDCCMYNLFSSKFNYWYSL